ncbi:hypothetical protein HOM50_04560 [bacterium]|jgi:hypothetical protein|nr:hypothetical protein [bacterium]MBT5015651.1 hypothetical protein [bacterium]
MIIKNILISITLSLLVSWNMTAGFMGDPGPATTSGSSYSAVYKLLGLGGVVGVSALSGYLYAMSSNKATLVQIQKTLADVQSASETVRSKLAENEEVRDEIITLVRGREGQDLEAVNQVERITREKAAMLETVKGLNNRFAEVGTLVNDPVGLNLLLNEMDGTQGEVRFLGVASKVVRENPLIMVSLNPDGKSEVWKEQRESKRQGLLALLPAE